MRLLKYILIPSSIALITMGFAQAEITSVDASVMDNLKATSNTSEEPAASEDSLLVGGMTVFIDEETGEFRQPTAEEAAVLSAAMQRVFSSVAKSAASSAAPQAFAGGAKGVRLGLNQMAFSVATVGTHGKITQECAHGPEQAKTHLHNHVAMPEEK
jgi:hypothetical protein